MKKIKAVILAAERPGAKIPKAIDGYKNGKCLLQFQIKTLLLSGFSAQNIDVVIDKGEVWTSEFLEFLKTLLHESNIHRFDVKEHTYSAESIRAYVYSTDSELEFERYLFVYGNYYLPIGSIDALKEMRGANLLTVDGVTTNRESRSFCIKNGILERENKALLPYKLFAGALSFDSELIRDFNWRNVSALEFAIENGFQVIDSSSTDFFTGEGDSQLKGGSYATLGKKFIVKKGAVKRGLDKVINEYEWLKRLPPKVRNYFPLVLESFSDEKEAWFEMPYYPLPSLRKLLISSEVDIDLGFEYVSKVVRFLKEELHSVEMGTIDSNYIYNSHLSRVIDRTKDLPNLNPKYTSLLSHDYIFINGRRFLNILPAMKKLTQNIKKIEHIIPDRKVMIHGDFHFQNILFDTSNNSFILADPRGELDGGDVFYDLGKLTHSVRAKYDLIHTGLFHLKYDESLDRFDYNFDVVHDVSIVYDELFRKITLLLVEEYEDFGEVETALLFNEAMHLASVSIFHVNRYDNEDRPILMYLKGVELLNMLIHKLEL